MATLTQQDQARVNALVAENGAWVDHATALARRGASREEIAQAMAHANAALTAARRIVEAAAQEAEPPVRL